MLVLAVAVLFSCKDDEKYAPKIASPGQIQFQVADAQLIGAATNGVVQPSMAVAAGRFAKANVASANYAGGNLVITTNLSPNVTGLTINLLTLNSTSLPADQNPGGVYRETKATLTGSGAITWTQPIAALQLKGVNLTIGASGTAYQFEFIATGADGAVISSRIFIATLLP